MKKQLPPLLLALSLLLTACAPSPSQETQQPALPADEIAQAVLAVCERDAAGLERLDSQLDGDGLNAYVSGFYHLPADSWDDCAIYRAAVSAEAFEIAVFRLSDTADSNSVLAGLEEYLLDRQGDFTGYAPEQAAIVADSHALLSNGGSYAALLICQEADAAQTAFYEALGQDAPELRLSTDSPIVNHGRTPFTAPNIDDMTLYDTSAILAAWDSGDHSSLSDKDAAILAAAETVLGEVITEPMNDYEKEWAVYSWLTRSVTYDWDHYNLQVTMDADSYSPYGALVNGKAVCLGYASTFQLFMDLLDVKCITVVGAAFQSREDHAWNMVNLNGEWYCVDPTWDNNSGGHLEYCSFFNVTSDYMAATDHQWDYDSIPEATAIDEGKG